MKTTTNSLQIRRIFRDSLKLYFAPLTGAYKGIKNEMLRVDREIVRDRGAQAKRSNTAPHA
ncbi:MULTISPECIES: hypothetical protein [Comamonadaceae]|uniref:Uncharacterized protein n=1 Tax=Simplicispira suum TaxID=2109915 RepID=A0A2S0N5H9_9BURK|nr:MULTISPECIES: hypothetical protein [Comamonadaceae]ADV02163.1 hypothetical protein Alide_4561 [Alicycliphilus denitrificans BC]AVO43366.1 hypothetical protein C6571_18140 [Simplicispira suum]